MVNDSAALEQIQTHLQDHRMSTHRTGETHDAAANRKAPQKRAEATTPDERGGPGQRGRPGRRRAGMRDGELDTLAVTVCCALRRLSRHTEDKEKTEIKLKMKAAGVRSGAH